MHEFEPGHAGGFVGFWHYWLQVRTPHAEGMWNLPFLEYTQKNISNYLRVWQHLVFILHDDWSNHLKFSHESHEVWLVLHRVPHRNQIQRKNWEMVSVPFLLFVPQSCAEGSKGWFSCPVLASTQCLQPVAVLWEAVRRELVVLLVQGWDTEASPCFELGTAEDTAWAAPSQDQGVPYPHQLSLSWGAWLCLAPALQCVAEGMVWCVQRREEVQGPSQVLWLSQFVPVLAVVQTWRCSHLPSVSEEPFLLYTFIFTASLRHPSGSVLILPLQKIEIFISPFISEKLRFLSPWIIWLALCYAAFAASLLYNHRSSQYSVIQPQSSP